MLAGFVLWAASGLGAALLAPLVSALMEQLGWQGTFWSLGAVGGGLILRLESSAQVLIPHWETSVLPEAGATPTSTVS